MSHAFAHRAALGAAALSAIAATRVVSAVGIDFENPPYAAGTIIGQDGWDQSNYAGNRNGDVDVSTDGALNGAQSLFYSQTSAPTGFAAGDVFKADVISSVVADGTEARDFTGSILVQSDSNGTGGGAGGFIISNGAASGNSAIAVLLNASGEIQVNDGTGFDPHASYTPGNVLAVSFAVDLDTEVYDVTIFDQTAGSPVPLTGGSGAGGAFTFANTFSADADTTYSPDVGLLLRGGDVHVDDLSLTAAAVPEPAAASLTLLATAGAMLRRRRSGRSA